MQTFEVYTIGNAYFLEKILNAVRMVFSGDLTGVLKVAVAISLTLLVIKASVTNDFKEIARWMAGIIVLIGLFLNTKASVVIHDRLSDSYGRLQASYIVDDVPWGLAWIAHATSSIGNTMMTKFEAAFAGATNNKTYKEYGILFGSKIVEDASRIRISNADLRSNIMKFYRQCIVPDLRIGKNRTNGYTLKDLAETENIGDFLKEHASNARLIYFNGTVTKNTAASGYAGLFGNSTKTINDINGYITCNKAAHHIYDMVAHEIENNKYRISASFVGQFFDDKATVQAKNKFFDSVLKDTYGSFLKASKDASEILKQNVMINSITDSAKSVASSYARTATDEMTRSSMHSVAQVFQKFIPVIRSALECLFYGMSPLVIILMVTPIGLQVLRHYAYAFVYLQMWPPMYAILYVMSEIYTRFMSSGLAHTMESLPQIQAINHDISMVSGYMLASIPVLAAWATNGLVSSVGSMASSMMYIPQTAAVNASDQAVKGNFSIGNTNLDNHSYDNVNAHKHDDNHSWSSGMRNWNTLSGATVKETPSGARKVDLSGAGHNLGGRVNIDWNQAMGTSFNQSESHAQKDLKLASKDHTKSLSTGISKLLGYDDGYTKGTSANDAINRGMTVEQRESANYVRGISDKIAKNTGISSNDVFKMATNVKAGIEIGVTSASVELTGSTESQKQKGWSQVQDAMKDEKFSKSLGIVESFGKTSNIQTGDSESQSTVDSMKADFNQASSASSRVSQAQEKLHSIQEAESNYKSNSRSINASYNQEFGDWATKNYGVEGLAQRTETSAGSEGLAQEFLKDKGYVASSTDISTTLPSRDLSLTNTDQKAFEDRHKGNQAAVNEHSGGFIAKSQDDRKNLESKYNDQNAAFGRHADQRKQQLTEKQKTIETKASDREKEGKQKVSQLASEHAGGRIVDTVKSLVNHNQGDK